MGPGRQVPCGAGGGAEQGDACLARQGLAGMLLFVLLYVPNEATPLDILQKANFTKSGFNHLDAELFLLVARATHADIALNAD